jgi:hypothetical protein
MRELLKTSVSEGNPTGISGGSLYRYSVLLYRKTKLNGRLS